MDEVKHKPTSIPDVIDITGDNDSDDSLEDSSDGSTSDCKGFVDSIKKMLLGQDLTDEFVEDIDSLYNCVRSIKKRISIYKKKKKCHKDQTLHLKADNNSAIEPKLKEEPIAEIKSEVELPVWHEPASPPSKKLNSPSESVQFSTQENENILPTIKIEAPPIEDMGNSMTPISLRRYDDLDNGDLDYLEETMDFEVENSHRDTSPSIKINSQNPIDSNYCDSRSAIDQLPTQINYIGEVEQWIKYEPELTIIDDDESIYRSSDNYSNFPLPETINHEPVVENPKITSSGFNQVALNEILTISAGSTDQPVAIKQELVEKNSMKPIPNNSKFDDLTLSNEDENDKQRITDVSCKMEISSEEIDDNYGEKFVDCDNNSTDSTLSICSDDNIGLHEIQHAKSREEIQRLSSTSEQRRWKLRDGNNEDNSRDSPLKSIPEDLCLSNDVAKNTIIEHEFRAKREQCVGNEERIGTANEEVISKESSGTRISKDRSGNRVLPTNWKHRDKKESRSKTQPHDKKRSHDENEKLKNSRDKKRSTDETKSCGKETCGIKRSIDEKLYRCDKKPRYEKTLCDGMWERRIFDEEEKCNKQRSNDEKKPHDYTRSSEKKSHKHQRFDEKRSYELTESNEKKPHEQQTLDEKKSYEHTKSSEKKSHNQQRIDEKKSYEHTKSSEKKSHNQQRIDEKKSYEHTKSREKKSHEQRKFYEKESHEHTESSEKKPHEQSRFDEKESYEHTESSEKKSQEQRINEKESYEHTESSKKKPHKQQKFDEKKSYEHTASSEKKSHNQRRFYEKRSYVQTKSSEKKSHEQRRFDEKESYEHAESSEKKPQEQQRFDEKRSYEHTKSSEKKPHEKQRFDEKKSYEHTASSEKKSHDQQRLDEKRSYEHTKSSENKSHEQNKSSKNKSHKQKRSEQKFLHTKEKLPADRDTETEDKASMNLKLKNNSHKHDVVKRRHSIGTELAETSNSYGSYEDSSSAESSVNCRLMQSEFPLVVLQKLSDQIKSPSPIKSPVYTTEDRSVKKTLVAFTSSQDSLECNQREVPSTTKRNISASKSTTKRNSHYMFKSNTEMKHYSKEDKQQLKSADSTADSKAHTATQILQTAMTLSEYKSVLEVVSTTLEVKMAVETGDHFLTRKQDERTSKPLNESEPTSLMKTQYEDHEKLNECSIGKKRKDKSVDTFSCAEEAKRRKTSKISRIEGSADASPTNGNNLLGVNAETQKSWNSAREALGKDRNSSEGDGNSIEKSSSLETNFSSYAEQKSVADLIEFKIPKKSATQRTATNMSATLNYYEDNFASSSEAHAGRSPIEDQDRRGKIWKTVITLVKEGRRQTTSRKIGDPWAMDNAKDTKPYPNLEQFLLRIFHWNPAWLKEKIRLNVSRKVVDEEHLAPLRPYYETYEDYYSDAERILALEVWHEMTSQKEISSMNATRSIKFSIVSLSANVKKLPSRKIEMMTFLLDVVVSKREASKQAHPIVGDLVSIEYSSVQQGNGTPTRIEVFGYVTHIRSNVIAKTTRFNRDLLNHARNAHTLLTYTMITKPVHHSEVQTNTIGKMTTIPYFRPNTRSILALQHLPDSPLLNMIIHPKIEDYQPLHTEDLQKYPFVMKENLNARQLEAIARITDTVVSQVPKICLIEGPPGTGKTKVITNLLTQITHGGGRHPKELPFRILVCASSNVAVDEIVMRLLQQRRMFKREQRFKMVRVGHSNTMPPNVKEVSLTELASKEVDRMIDTWSNFSPEMVQRLITCYENEITELELKRTQAKSVDFKKSITRQIEDIRTKYDFLKNIRTTDQLVPKEQRKALNRVAENTILEGAHIIACTLASCGTKYMEAIFGYGKSKAISVCIVDDATKCPEGNTLLPLLFGIKTLVLVGDSHQLPVLNFPDRPKFHGLNQSLFARVQRAFAGLEFNPTIQFEAQYRMSHPVALWPNEHFYNGVLYNAANLPALPLHSYKVINLDSTQDFKGKPSTTNTREAIFIAHLVYTIMTCTELDHSRTPFRVGVITPHKHQSSLIENKIKDLISQFPPKRSEIITLDVNTIDGFQGQERDVVIMSCVRSSGLGCWADQQKLCLAMTRARHSLIICGNFHTFQNNRTWKELLLDAKSRGVFADVRWDATADEVKAHVVRTSATLNSSLFPSEINTVEASKYFL